MHLAKMTIRQHRKRRAQLRNMANRSEPFRKSDELSQIFSGVRFKKVHLTKVKSFRSIRRALVATLCSFSLAACGATGNAVTPRTSVVTAQSFHWQTKALPSLARVSTSDITAHDLGLITRVSAASDGKKTAMFGSSSSNDAPVAVSPSLLADGSRAFVLDYADGTSIVAKVKDDNTLSLERPDGTSVDASFAFQTNADQSITIIALVGQVSTSVNVASDASSGTANEERKASIDE